MRHFSNEQLLMARKADLYDYLLTHHADDFVMEGRSIRMLDNHSISIREGQTGYRDFATDESGNSVDFLVRYMGYELDDAIFALCRNTEEEHITTYTRPVLSVSENDLPPEFPAPASSYEQMFAYLMSRGIPAVTIQMLVDQGLLYQSADHNNCVFINREKDWAEIRGTYTFGKPYHGIVSHARKDGFWWFRTDRSAKICYVCEASIDAISLYELHKRQGRHESAYYIGIGEDISYGGHKYDHMKIPAGSKFSAEFRGVFTDLIGSFTPFTLQLGEETWLAPSLDLGLVAILGQYEVDAGRARGTAVYQNPPVDFVVGGSADSFIGVPAPRIGAGAELRVGPDDWVQWVFRAGFGYFAYDGGTGVFARGGSREKNIDISMLTLAFEAEVLLPMDDFSCFSVGARLEYLHLDGSVASKEKSDAEIIAARERFDKSFDFKSWSAILYVGVAY